MNDTNRKAANAVVAVVDFFSGALAAEAQVGDESQKRLNALVDQLKVSSSTVADRELLLEMRQVELTEQLAKVAQLKARVVELESRESDALSKVGVLMVRVAELEEQLSAPDDARKVSDLINASASLQHSAVVSGRIRNDEAVFLFFEKALAALQEARNRG
jgi:uncharacterized coiled-coil protein SlyX